jgi:hypothetical protein
MTEKVTYYAVVDSFSTRECPAGVLRRIEHDGGQRDEAFGNNLVWGHTTLLYSAERGNLDNELYEIGEEEASQIVALIRSENPPRPCPSETEEFPMAPAGPLPDIPDTPGAHPRSAASARGGGVKACGLRRRRGGLPRRSWGRTRPCATRGR